MCLALVALFHVQVTVASYEAEIPSVEAKIALYANKWGQPYSLMYCMVNRETAGTFDPKVQSSVFYAFSDPKRGIVRGTQERSFGLAQIHEPDHPKITREEMYDPDFALDFMGRNLAAGNGSWMWKTTHRACRK